MNKYQQQFVQLIEDMRSGKFERRDLDRFYDELNEIDDDGVVRSVGKVEIDEIEEVEIDEIEEVEIDEIEEVEIEIEEELDAKERLEALEKILHEHGCDDLGQAESWLRGMAEMRDSLYLNV